MILANFARLIHGWLPRQSPEQGDHHHVPAPDSQQLICSAPRSKNGWKLPGVSNDGREIRGCGAWILTPANQSNIHGAVVLVRILSITAARERKNSFFFSNQISFPQTPVRSLFGRVEGCFR